MGVGQADRGRASNFGVMPEADSMADWVWVSSRQARATHANGPPFMAEGVIGDEMAFGNNSGGDGGMSLDMFPDAEKRGGDFFLFQQVEQRGSAGFGPSSKVRATLLPAPIAQQDGGAKELELNKRDTGGNHQHVECPDGSDDPDRSQPLNNAQAMQATTRVASVVRASRDIGLAAKSNRYALDRPAAKIAGVKGASFQPQSGDIESGLTEQQIAQILDRGVAETVEYARASSPFYRELLKDARGGRGRGLAGVTVDEQEAGVGIQRGVLVRGAGEDHGYLHDQRNERVPTFIPLTAGDLERLGDEESCVSRGRDCRAGDRVILAVTIDKCFMAGLAYFEGLRGWA